METKKVKRQPNPAVHARGNCGAEDHTQSQAKTPDKVDRVNRCVELMATGRWVPGVTNVQVADEYGVAVKTVEADAAEASRRIQALTRSDGEVKAMLESALAEAMRMAAEDGGAKGSQALTRAVEVFAGLRGLKAAEKHDIGGTLGELLALAGRSGGD